MNVFSSKQSSIKNHGSMKGKLKSQFLKERSKLTCFLVKNRFRLIASFLMLFFIFALNNSSISSANNGNPAELSEKVVSDSQIAIKDIKNAASKDFLKNSLLKNHSAQSLFFWTTSAPTAGWYGDNNVPSGQPVNNPFPDPGSTTNYSSIGQMTAGAGLTMANFTLGTCCTTFRMTNVAATSYAAAVTNNEYIYSTLVVSSSSPSVRISEYRFNQIQFDANSNPTGSQIVVALYDVTAGTLTQISNAAAMRGATNSLAVTISSLPVLIPGRTYQLRQYFYSSTGTALANYYLDNPNFYTQVNQAPTAGSDSFSTNDTNSVTISPLANDTDPENNTLTITQINGTNISVGGSVSVTGGTVTLNSGGTLTFTPTLGYSGSPSFNYTISDGNNNTATGSVSGTITATQYLQCGPVYASESNPSFFKRIYTLSGTTATLFNGSIASTQNLAAIAQGTDTKIYFDNGSTTSIYNYNGTTTSLLSGTWQQWTTSSGPGGGWDGNIYYVGTNYHLFQVTQTGTVTDLGALVGATGDTIYNTLQYGDVASDANGRIYWYASVGATGASYLYRIDKNTLKATNMGNVGPNAASGLAFDTSGNLITTTVPASTTNVYSINLSSFTSTNLGTVTGLQASGATVYDLASCTMPTLNPILNITKSVANITKSQTPATLASSGDTLEYTITVTNTGNLPSDSTTLSDNIPTGTTYVAGSTTLNGVAVSDVSSKMPYDPTGTGTRLINSPSKLAGDVEVGASDAAVVKFRVTVNASGLPTTISNTATVNYPTVSGGVTTFNNLTSSSADVPTPVPNVTGYKSAKLTSDFDGTGTVTPYDRVTYTLSYVNTGTGSVTNFQIADPLPTGVSLTSGSTAVSISGSGTSATRNTSYNGTTNTNLLAASATLAPGGIITVTIEVEIGTTTGTALNQGTATATGLSSSVLTDNVGSTSDLPSSVTASPYNLTVPSGSILQTTTAAIDPTGFVIGSQPTSSAVCGVPLSSLTSLNFSGAATLESGTANTAGAVYRFSNVATGLDARVTLLAISGTVNTLLSAGIQGNLTGTSGLFRLQVDLVNTGTNTLATPTNFGIYSFDIDGVNFGSTNTLSDYAEFYSPNTVGLYSPTRLIFATTANGQKASQNVSANYFNANGNDPQNAAFAVYYNRNSFTVEGGFGGGTSASRGITFGGNTAVLSTITNTSCTTVSSPTFTISGTVFNDADSSKVQNGTETGTNAGGLTAVLVNSSNVVVATATVPANGTYSFSNVSVGNYTVLITTNTATVGSTAPAVALPANWSDTGENLGGTIDGTVDGKLAVSISFSNVSGANFGILPAPVVAGYKSVKLITDADSSGTITAGDTVTYTIQYANTGPGNATSFQLNDVLPSGLTITATGAQTVTVSGSGTSASKNTAYTGATAGAVSDLLASGATLASGGVVSVSIPATVNASVSGALANQATATGTGISTSVLTDNAGATSDLPSSVTSAPYNLTIPTGSVTQTISGAISPTNMTVAQLPELTLAKSHTGSFTVGSTGTYTMTVSNSGGASFGTITVSDTLPAGLTVADGSVTLGGTNSANWSCTAASNVITCTSSTAIAASGTSVFNFAVNVGLGTAVGTNSVTNSASISGGGDSNTSNNSASDPTTVLSPNLTITKADMANFTVGSAGTYQITVGNSGTAATSGTITVSDTLPTGLTVPNGALTLGGAQSANWSCSAANNVITCTSSTAIATSGSSVFTFSVNVGANAPVGTGSISNTATVSGGGEATANNTDNSGSDTTTVLSPDLTVAKSHSGNFTKGATGTYSIVVSNSGTASTSGTITVSDTLPTGLSVPNGALTLSGTNAANWSCSAASNVITCTSTTAIATSGSNTFNFNVNVSITAPDSFTNTASVSGGGEATANNTNNSASDPTNTVSNPPNVELLKSCPSPANCTTAPQLPGTDITYKIEFTNTGGLPAANMILVDGIPANMDYKVNSATSNLGTTGLTMAIEYSSDYDPLSPGTATWAYTPVSGGGGASSGYDRIVKAIRWRVTSGALSNISPNNIGDISFIAKIR